MGARDDFDGNVFINCPFDDEYLELLRPLLFTLAFLGFKPRIASERLDSLEVRLSKICDLISKSRYGIHDLSRLKAGEVGEFYRMNMPFELGIEYGCRIYGQGSLKQKRCLILEKEPHDFRRALSDLAGVDIRNHGNDPISLVKRYETGFERLPVCRMSGAQPVFGIASTTSPPTFTTSGGPRITVTKT